MIAKKTQNSNFYTQNIFTSVTMVI